MTIQRYEIEAWLGDHSLTDDQITELMRISDEASDLYPDDEATATAALGAAYRAMTEGAESVVDDLAADLTRARIAEIEAIAGLRQVAAMTVQPGGTDIASQAGFAERAGVDRMTVRKWLGLR